MKTNRKLPDTNFRNRVRNRNRVRVRFRCMVYTGFQWFLVVSDWFPLYYRFKHYIFAPNPLPSPPPTPYIHKAAEFGGGYGWEGGGVRPWNGAFAWALW